MPKQDIAREFYSITGRKSTKQLFLITMQQAQSLLDAGYLEEDIISAIYYCSINPPKKGFHSLGWLQYDIDNILNKIKAKEIREFHSNLAITPISCKQIEIKIKNIKERAGSEFDFDDYGVDT